jgi:hypothetical protein
MNERILPSRRQDERSRGIALIELLGAVLVAAVLMGVAAALLATMLRIERSYAPDTATQSELERLGAYLRQDAHEAEALAVAEDGRNWSFAMPHGTRVRYGVLAESVERTESTDGMADATRRQELQLSERAEASLREVSIAGKPFAQLVVRSPSPDASGHVVYQVDSALRHIE